MPVTIAQLSEKELHNVILSTNDDFLLNEYEDTCVKIHHRSDATSTDTASMHSVLTEVVADMGIKPDDDLIVLYPTYVGRTLRDIRNVYQYFQSTASPSTLCCYECTDAPEMYINAKTHGKYRRQEYDKQYVYSHFVAVVMVKHLSDLDEQLRCNLTSYYTLLSKPKDVDSLKDLL